MSTELRVLWATIVIAALLTGLASWLAQRRSVRAPVESHDDTTETAPWLTWSAPPTASRDASVRLDASTSSDAGPSNEGPSTEARDRLGALLAAAICARREECLCGAYPSPYSEGHETATTCEADVLRDLHRQWEEQVTTPVVLVDDEALHAAIDRSIRCTGTAADLHDFLRQDAVDGERCDSEWPCRDGSGCEQGGCERGAEGCGRKCVAASGLGEACTLACTWGAYIRRCDRDLRCVHGRCEETLPPDAPCDSERNRCRGLCVTGHCQLTLGERLQCLSDEDCLDGQACVDRRCREAGPLHPRCERPALRRFVGQHSEGDAHAATECVPVGTPCHYGADCGTGRCEGAGAARCGEPGPHAASPREIGGGSATRTCEPGEGCGAGWCVCPRGQRCRSHTIDTWCDDTVARGEPCVWDECAEGLVCQHEVPEGGRCVAALCMQTRFFD